ncbi:uncharacterized protein HMPREF1541_08896 [Cyphellophora europaea CBS 101466]|uniref:Autophagy-related protein n=1 Tax=Cyphellophora europaea (strain CBS 101466) TaxID=1220924 RepID=W2RLM9_CYPE1|nr:uncharacterized protein HMPREF1541_08896 [Cyphellophora europaea CBS 101466]ETN36618.1 hypothetical protein HMPREF1541_08896 [Cyphellophora europaea CBS 101466]
MEDTEIHSPTVQRRYEEEDISPTSDKELRGWYFYGIAAEVFAVCGPGSFLPVVLEQLARENGVLWSDRQTPCVDTRNDRSGRLLMGRAEGEKNDQCLINVLGAEITTASFAMYTFSLAVLIQALALVSFSSVADYGNNRKRFLLLFASVGSAAGMAFIFMVPSIYLLATPLAVLAITNLGCSFVMLNSFLPLLSSNHPSVRAQEKELLSTPTPSHDPNAPSSAAPTTARSAPALAFSNTVSAKGVGLGYSAAVLVQIASILLLLLTSKLTTSRTVPLRLALFLASTWWCLFTIPTSLWLRSRPGPPLPATLTHRLATHPSSRLRTATTYLTFAWLSIFRTLQQALSLSQTRLFLLAWFLMSDAIATVGSTAIMFARTELHLSPTGIALLSVTATASGIAGSLLWPLLAHRFFKPQSSSSSSSRNTIVACLCVMEFIPLYGLLGYLPPVQTLGWLGLQRPWEIFPLAVVYGVAMGGLSSYCRSFFGQLIPFGKEAAFYALFAITDKGSSAIGPAVVGRIVDRTGTIRPAFWFLVVLIGIPIVLVRFVDEARGREEAGRFDLGMVMAGDGLEMMGDSIGSRGGRPEEVQGLMEGEDRDRDNRD